MNQLRPIQGVCEARLHLQSACLPSAIWLQKAGACFLLHVDTGRHSKKSHHHPCHYCTKEILECVGYLWIGFWQVIGSMYLPSSWPGSESFQQTSLPLRFLLLPLWVKIVLSKYIFSWLLAESVCVLSGLSFVEQREDGSVDWRGCANVKVHR